MQKEYRADFEEYKETNDVRIAKAEKAQVQGFHRLEKMLIPIGIKLGTIKGKSQQ